MQIEQSVWSEGVGWQPAIGAAGAAAQLVLAFGASDLGETSALLDELRAAYPDAVVVGCSTAGEIHGTRVLDGTLTATAVTFSSATARGSRIRLSHADDSRAAAERLVRPLLAADLRHVLVFSNGRHVNGSQLVDGLQQTLPDHLTVTGGLACGGLDLGRSWVALDGPADDESVAAVGLYGERLAIGYGSLGGWDPFGPERLITRAEGHRLFELDGQSALGLYKRYLGELAAELPASALLFPLSLRTPDGSTGIVRTVLAIDEERGSMTFAGDMPQGSYARLMKANFERLIDGATEAARTSAEPLVSGSAELALLVSCVGRRLVLKQRVEEELEGVRDVLGAATVLTGFYSLGEISPFTPEARCELHNQTMTITTFRER